MRTYTGFSSKSADELDRCQHPKFESGLPKIGASEPFWIRPKQIPDQYA